MKKLNLNRGREVLGLWIWVLISAIIHLTSVNTVLGGETVSPHQNTNAFFQTNGPQSEFKWGDWWTNDDPTAGNQPHMFEIYVPQTVSNSFTLEIELYDPESFQTGSEIDELENADLPNPEWDATHFWLVAPDGTTEIVNITYPPQATTSEKWNSFASVPIATFGTGIYRLYSITDVDDQNSFKIKIVEADPDGSPNSGDEINVAPVKSAYQHHVTGCTTFWFYVSEKPELRLANFDMDGATSVTYTDPDGNTFNGSVSGSTVWNNNGTSAYPPPGGDVFVNPRTGWWKAELCISVEDQYIFYTEGGIFIEHLPTYPHVTINKDDGIVETVPNYKQTYTISVENTGSGPALNTVVTDTLPTNVSFKSATGNPTITSFGNTYILEWDLGLLKAGQDSSVYLSVQVHSEATESVFNKAYVRYEDVILNKYTGIYDSDLDVLVPPATIGNLVWYDNDSSGTQNGAETGLENVTMYLKDEVGVKVDSQITNSNGNYSFTNVLPASYTVDVKNSSISVKFECTTLNDPLSVTVSSGENYTDANFGYKESLDSDGDGIGNNLEGDDDRDGDGIPDNEDYDPAGYIYAESTGEILSGGSIDVTGPGSIMIIHDGSTGYYEFYTDGTPGTYTVTVNPPPGYQPSTTCLSSDPPPFDPTGQSNPVVLGHGEVASTGYLSSADCTPFYFTFDLGPGDPFIINNNYPMRFLGTDCGDARDPSYPTLMASNGAWHNILPGYYLGSSVDAEPNGQPSSIAMGDDLDGNDDDDGIIFSGTLMQFAQNSIQVIASGNGYLNAWMDLNLDGDWVDANEQIIVNKAITAGTQTVTFNLPAITFQKPLRKVGMMARFRFASYPDLSFTGGASDGEVEDYLIDTWIPVELTNFTVETKNGCALLSWQTQTESDNLGFYIYRSDKINGEYEKINSDMIDGAGSSESIHNYSYLDKTAESGKTYFYKIADVSFNGAITKHGAKEVTIELPMNYKLAQNYPNPFNPTTTLIITSIYSQVAFSYVRDKPYGFFLGPTLLII